jgi:hypothetical protein
MERRHLMIACKQLAPAPIDERSRGVFKRNVSGIAFLRRWLGGGINGKQPSRISLVVPAATRSSRHGV